MNSEMNTGSMRIEAVSAYRSIVLCTIVLIALSLWCGHVMGQAEWRPSRNIELVVQAGAGGASDRAARTLQKIMQEKRLVDASSTVVNKAGGGGALAYNYVNQHAGDAHRGRGFEGAGLGHRRVPRLDGAARPPRDEFHGHGR